MTTRPCARCGADATQYVEREQQGLVEARNAHGVPLGLFGAGCLPVVKDAIIAVDRRHGADITPDGAYLRSPRGTPRDPEAYRPLWDMSAGDPRRCPEPPADR